MVCSFTYLSSGPWKTIGSQCCFADSALSSKWNTTMMRPKPGRGTQRLISPYAVKWLWSTSSTTGWKNDFGRPVTVIVFVFCDGGGYDDGLEDGRDVE